ncbi:heterokaryon incompatibility protein-domain-containing protein [Cercophora samala]|uniref:Heterokaryon incompatibility protein-domain-containing protein n=1 Tax=Cercophora samala TaxID=330535 RepID=A0AA39ZC62_9PEZI|nr:heterokaryon incompatibility protein-domain-containing protein [Cercophora samala]
MRISIKRRIRASVASSKWKSTTKWTVVEKNVPVAGNNVAGEHSAEQDVADHVTNEHVAEEHVQVDGHTQDKNTTLEIHRPQRPPQKLCENCERLQLSSPRTVLDEAETEVSIDLGHLDPTEKYGPIDRGEALVLQMEKTSCPFCHLVLMARHDYFIDYATPLKWTKESGFHFTQDSDRLVYLQTPGQSQPSFSAHELGRKIPPRVDTRLIRDWLLRCEGLHGQDSASPCVPRRVVLQSPDAPLGLKCLRFIHVERQCLVPATEVDGGRCPRYVTLSYLWGDVKQMVLLKKESLQTFSRDGVLATTQWPQTIADAMTLVAKIGERYLWVDSLCIIQDDEEDMANNIMKMDLIYQGGVLNIVSGVGNDSNAGLPGLRPGSRSVVQLIEQVLPNVFMTHVSCLYKLLTESRYMNRGWTFQEFILSPRNVIFLDGCVYFLCGKRVWSEDTLYDMYADVPHNNIGISGSVQRFTSNPSQAWATFSAFLFRYTGRELSFQGDYLNAMTGILHRFCDDADTGHLSGLPLRYFDLGLLHWSHDGPRERLEQFPSWSWTGWYRCWTVTPRPQHEEEWLRKNTYIVWYVKDSPEPARDTFVEEQHRGLEDGKEKAALYAQREPPLPPCVQPGEYKPAAYPTRQTILLPPPSTPILQFWAQTIVLSLEPRDDCTRSKNFTAFHHHHCQHCGSVRLDSDLDVQQMDKNKVNAVILSSAILQDMDIYWSRPKPDGPSYYVLVVEWVGDDQTVAERKGVGSVHQACVAGAGAGAVVWREIALR